MPKNKKLALNSGIQTYHIFRNDDEVCIPSLFSILLAVNLKKNFNFWLSNTFLSIDFKKRHFKLTIQL